MEAADEFYVLAKDFINAISDETQIIPIEELSCLLTALYIGGLKLTLCDPDTYKGERIKHSQNPIRTTIPEIMYWETFNSVNDPEIVACSFHDDISDIAQDLLTGIQEYEAGKKNNARFEWALMFDCHWGCHAVNAIRALHFAR